ncbi:hypothetical protein RhiLY_08376 [Ceratobasidium sp. AG-Ba]|nr:hypothetical protein RhiLY_08376 [Ceratobasidium sp. AG-Ba]
MGLMITNSAEQAPFRTLFKLIRAQTKSGWRSYHGEKVSRCKLLQWWKVDCKTLFWTLSANVCAISYYFEQHWSITINFESAEKGGLVAKAERHIEEPKIISDKNGHAFVADDMMYAQQVKDIIGNALNMEKNIEDVNRIFSVPWDFYFPGSGVFLLKSPKFNNEGDLLVELDNVEGEKRND